MVQQIPVNMGKYCYECRAKLEYTGPTLKPKYCSDRCRQAAEQRRGSQDGPGRCGWRPDASREELARTKDELRVARDEMDWLRRRLQDRPTDTGEVRWMIRELVQLPGVGGSGDSDTPESIVARVRGIITEANNRAMAWERKAKARR